MTRSPHTMRGVPPKLPKLRLGPVAAELVVLAPPVMLLMVLQVALAPPAVPTRGVAAMQLALVPTAAVTSNPCWQAQTHHRSPKGVPNSKSSGSDAALLTSSSSTITLFTFFGRPSRRSQVLTECLTQVLLASQAAQKLS